MSDNNSFSVHPTSGINRKKHEQGEEVGMIIMMTMIMMEMDG
jgi:hypothetical protein